MYIGAVWRINEGHARSIHNDFTYSIAVATSKDGVHWYGASESYLEDCGIPLNIGDSMPPEIIPINNIPTDGLKVCWDVIAHLLKSNMLGSPTRGIFLRHGEEQNICECDKAIVLTQGCVSARGKPCPKHKMNY